MRNYRAQVMPAECSVYELRQYTLHPRSREAFVDLFDREFAETQEAAGIRIVGQYRDLDRPDVFVWIRGFADMASRHESLEAFYGGPVWAAHRDTANSMILDSDDVLLLAPVGDGPSLGDRTVRLLPPRAPRSNWTPILVADVYPVNGSTPAQLDGLCERAAAALAPSGGEHLAALRTCDAVNTFPRLPVREGEDVLVTIQRLPHQSARARLVAAVGGVTHAPAQTLRLAPTPRSALR